MYEDMKVAVAENGRSLLLLLAIYLIFLNKYQTVCGVKNTFGILVHSKKYTFPVFNYGAENW
jgi:hypothetical protein